MVDVMRKDRVVRIPENTDEDMRIFRAHRGYFDAWRRYTITVDGNEGYHIADSQLLEIPGKVHHLNVSIGQYFSGDVGVDASDGYAVICELTANPKAESPQVRINVVTKDELLERLVRFDGLPFSRRNRSLRPARVIRSVMVIGAYTLYAIFFWMRAVTIHPAADLPLDTAGVLGWLLPGALVASGIRFLYYYFQWPQDWRR